MLDDAYDSDNVITVTFTQEASAYEALTQLKELSSQGQVSLREAAVVVRDDDGHIVEKDEAGDPNLVNTASGGLIGLLVGVLGGPLGILVGGATGVLVGSLFDLDDDDEMDSVLSEISRSIKIGPAALLAQVGEQSPAVIDTAMARLDGKVLRRPVDDVKAEIAAAEKAQHEAAKEARAQLREERQKKQKQQVDAKISELKAKFHGHNTPAGTSS